MAFSAYVWMYTEATAFCIDPGQQDKIRRRWIHSRVIDSRLLPLYTTMSASSYYAAAYRPRKVEYIFNLSSLSE